MSRLERLLKLAQKTGDTLIVHDEQNRDMVIMGVSMYEVLHDMQGMRSDMGYQGCVDCDCSRDESLADMTEREMLNKINEDIALWRSYQDEDEHWDRASYLEEDLVDHPPYDPFEEDLVHAPAWHKAGDILQDRKPDFEIPVDIDSESVDDIQIKETPINFLDNSIDDIAEEHSEPEYDDLGEASIGLGQKTNIPFVSRDDIADMEETSIEDDDEPVFFEEPV